jgi:Mrp family chromosome partitioning ATPase
LLDDRFVSVRDIKDQFGESVLGLVPQVRISRSKPQDGLLQPGDSRQPYAESYRHLRSALLLASGSEGRPQTILLTSAVRGEGKTTIAVNLARVLCRSGLRVALVDADRRGPGLHRLVSGQAHPGLLDYLRGGLAARSFMQTTAEPGLTFVSLGAEPQTEEGLFVRPRLADLIKELRQGHDFVILDGAPILAADDTALLAPYADLVVLVARPFFSKSQLIRRCLDMLYQRQVKQVAFILNRARPDDVAGHYSNLGNMAGIKS